MKVWITQYALTDGIEEHEAEFWRDKHVQLTGEEHKWNSLVHKPHWHLTREAAVARAEEMRQKAIANCARRLAKLHAMRFE